MQISTAQTWHGVCVCVCERESECVCVSQRGTENRYMQKESNSRMGSGQGTRIRSRKRDNRRPATEMSPTYVFPGMIGSSSDTVFKSGRVARELAITLEGNEAYNWAKYPSSQ